MKGNVAITIVFLLLTSVLLNFEPSVELESVGDELNSSTNSPEIQGEKWYRMTDSGSEWVKFE
tara:strand:+ start:88 stop:276 length:189 start_codon:yes stop_codon:yes gene_type:complete